MYMYICINRILFFFFFWEVGNVHGSYKTKYHSKSPLISFMTEVSCRYGTIQNVEHFTYMYKNSKPVKTVSHMMRIPISNFPDSHCRILTITIILSYTQRGGGIGVGAICYKLFPS